MIQAFPALHIILFKGRLPYIPLEDLAGLEEISEKIWNFPLIRRKACSFHVRTQPLCNFPPRRKRYKFRNAGCHKLISTEQNEPC